MVKKNGVREGLRGGKSRNFLHDLLQMNAINPSRNGFTESRFAFIRVIMVTMAVSPFASAASGVACNNSAAHPNRLDHLHQPGHVFIGDSANTYRSPCTENNDAVDVDKMFAFYGETSNTAVFVVGVVYSLKMESFRSD